MSDTSGVVLGLSLIGVTAIVVFEVVKRESASGNRICICGHKRSQHVHPGDYDCNVYIDGAEFDPWKCRKCRCRRFIPKS